MSYQVPEKGFRTFLILWVSQSVSVFGSALTLFAITVWLTQVLYAAPEQQPQLALALVVVSLAHSLPTILAGPLAGAWADRHDRKLTMMVMDIANGLLSVVLVALIVSGSLQLWLLMVVVLLSSVFGAFHFSAFDSSYAMIVPERQLPRANGMMQTIFDLSGILSPAIAAGLIALPALARQGRLSGAVGGALAQMDNGMVLAISIDAVTFFLAAIVLSLLYVPSPKRSDLVSEQTGQKKSIWADALEGALYIWHRSPLLWLLGMFTVANLFGSPIFVLQPLLVKFDLAADWAGRGLTFEAALAVLSSVGSLGGVVGGIAVSVWGGLKRKRVYGVIVAMLIAAGAEIILGLSSMLYLTAAMLFIVAAAIPIMNAHSQTIWQTQTPRELQGRVFAARRLVARFTWPLGAAFAGWVGGRFSPGLVLAAMGAIFLAATLPQLINRALLRVEDSAWLEQLAADKNKQKQPEHQ